MLLVIHWFFKIFWVTGPLRVTVLGNGPKKVGNHCLKGTVIIRKKLNNNRAGFRHWVMGERATLANQSRLRQPTKVICAECEDLIFESVPAKLNGVQNPIYTATRNRVWQPMGSVEATIIVMVQGSAVAGTSQASMDGFLTPQVSPRDWLKLALSRFHAATYSERYGSTMLTPF